MERDDFDCEDKYCVKNRKVEAKKKTKRKHKSESFISHSRRIVVNEEITKNLLKKIKKLNKKKKKDRNRKDAKFENNVNSCEINSITSEKSRNFAPMTKKEWEKQVNTLRRVYDEETGRTRLVKGTGEIVEECVSRDRQLSINKMATIKDGEYFQKILSSNFK